MNSPGIQSEIDIWSLLLEEGNLVALHRYSRTLPELVECNRVFAMGIIHERFSMLTWEPFQIDEAERQALLEKFEKKPSAGN